MERPSHIDFDSQVRCLPCRLPYVGLAISLQCAAVFLFIYGIANHTIGNIIRDIEVPPIQEQEVDKRVEPPEPTITKKIPTDPLVPPIFKTGQRPENPFPPQPPTRN